MTLHEDLMADVGFPALSSVNGRTVSYWRAGAVSAESISGVWISDADAVEEDSDQARREVSRARFQFLASALTGGAAARGDRIVHGGVTYFVESIRGGRGDGRGGGGVRVVEPGAYGIARRTFVMSGFAHRRGDAETRRRL